MNALDIPVSATAASSRAGITSRLWVRLQSDPAGVVEVPALKNPQIVIHSGPLSTLPASVEANPIRG